MSLTLTLIPIAMAVGMSLGSSSIAAILTGTGTKCHDLEPVETQFVNSEILLKTLTEHGLTVQKKTENEYIVSTVSGTLRYYRTSEQEPFMLEVSGIENMHELLESLDSLENEYGRNVQAFTYNKVMCSLKEHGMSVENEETLDDDSIMLTLKV